MTVAIFYRVYFSGFPDLDWLGMQCEKGWFSYSGI